MSFVRVGCTAWHVSLLLCGSNTIITALAMTAHVEQGIHLSEDKYCSLGAMLNQKAPFETTYEVVEEGTEWIRPDSEIEKIHL